MTLKEITSIALIFTENCLYYEFSVILFLSNKKSFIIDLIGGFLSKSNIKDYYMDKNTLNTSFGKWISPVNMKKLSEQVDILNQDYYTKKLTTEAYLKIMLFAQLHETESLHAISDALLDKDFQKAVGFEGISASQLSRKNNELDPYIIATIYLVFVCLILSHKHHDSIVKSLIYN